jgi:methanethiol S-methyltransferase
MIVIGFLYGVVCYAIFLGNFPCVIGFVGNVWAAKSIDSGVGGSLAEALLIDSLLLGLFSVQHRSVDVAD